MLIPFCKTLTSLIAFGTLLGFFDAGNYVLLPVLTFDLMGAEKMPVAWGFMMAVNAISCFGPPFAGELFNMKLYMKIVLNIDSLPVLIFKYLSILKQRIFLKQLITLLSILKGGFFWEASLACNSLDSPVLLYLGQWFPTLGSQPYLGLQ